MIVPSDSSTGSLSSVATLELTKGWSFQQSDKLEEGWMPVTSVPTNVHLDLLAIGRIPDPSLDLNELAVQWVSEKSWTYRCVFPASIGQGHRAELLLEGLDTFATVFLNDTQILSSDNMFVAHRVDVGKYLNTTGMNTLIINFEPALLRARELQSQEPRHKWICWNGEPARLGVRKAQYHWGWDWGPKLITCGPWKPIRLEIYKTRIVDLWAEVELANDYQSAAIQVRAEVSEETNTSVSFELHQGGQLVATKAVQASGQRAIVAEIRVDKPGLWWPVGYGTQPLYNITATLGFNGHQVTKKIGIRRIEVVQQRDKHGKSFFFRVNGIDIFGAGSNWIPADSFTPRISDQRYRDWLQILVDGRQCMIRCWGGGIWEPDIFFDICDELGILVWQDFLFACGNYPVNSKMIQSINAECATQLTRIRHHACIAILAGNNEDYVVQESSGLTYDYGDKDSANWLKSNFPARYIYETILPDAVKRYCPNITYHPGSPWGDGKITSDPTVGDIHQWNVWHGSQEKYQMYDKLGGRFVSEFGMGSLPHRQTIEQFVTKYGELYPQSRTLEFHNKATGGERRLAAYVSENLRMRHDLASWIYLTQLVQSEAMSYAFQSWRQDWGENRKVGGALCWQLNDCWPGTSWAICDYYQKKKPAYYAIKRALAPLAVAVKRDHIDWTDTTCPPPRRINFRVWVSSSYTQAKDVMVELRFISTRTGMDVQERITKSANATPNGTTEVISATLETDDEPYVIAARLFLGSVVSRDWDWPQPLKYLSLDNRGVEVKFDGDRAWVSAKRPTKCLVFEEREGIMLSDNGMDIMPGDVQMVQIGGLNEGVKLPWKYYDQPPENGETNFRRSLELGSPILSPTLRTPDSPRRRGLTVRFKDDSP